MLVGSGPLDKSQLIVAFSSAKIWASKSESLWIRSHEPWALPFTLFLNWTMGPGTELKLAEVARIDIRELCKDVSLDLLQYIDSSVTREHLAGHQPPNKRHAMCDDRYWPVVQSSSNNAFVLEQDSLDALIPAAVPTSAATNSEPAVVLAHQATSEHIVEDENSDSKTSRLFPNSFRIAGLKHICDNMLGAVLQGLPQQLFWAYEKDHLCTQCSVSFITLHFPLVKSPESLRWSGNIEW